VGACQGNGWGRTAVRPYTGERKKQKGATRKTSTKGAVIKKQKKKKKEKEIKK
jgi:hypothetical protein